MVDMYTNSNIYKAHEDPQQSSSKNDANASLMSQRHTRTHRPQNKKTLVRFHCTNTSANRGSLCGACLSNDRW